MSHFHNLYIFGMNSGIRRIVATNGVNRRRVKTILRLGYRCAVFGYLTRPNFFFFKTKLEIISLVLPKIRLVKAIIVNVQL